MRKFRGFLLLLCLGFAASLVQADPHSTEKLKIGKFESRAIWRSAHNVDETQRAPVIILVPGSGANGPEAMVPPNLTFNNQETSIFANVSEAFNKAGIHTLALGKPGVEFFSSWDPNTWFYDKELYSNLIWENLITNLDAAVEYVKKRPDVERDKIYILGHSEGTHVAIDYVSSNPNIEGIILIGFHGEDLASILKWQLFERYLEHFVIPDVDNNKDNFITNEEAAVWPEFSWEWEEGKEEVSIQELRDHFNNDPKLISLYEKLAHYKLWEGVFSRGPIYERTASLEQTIYVLNGELDLQTPAGQATTLKETCKKLNKENCFVTIVPGLGHGFSPPRRPREHPLLDMTIGSVSKGFQEILMELGHSLRESVW